MDFSKLFLSELLVLVKGVRCIYSLSSSFLSASGHEVHTSLQMTIF